MPTPKTPIPDDFEERYRKAKLEDNLTDRQICKRFGVSYCLLGRWKKEKNVNFGKVKVDRPPSTYDNIRIPIPDNFVETYMNERKNHSDAYIAEHIFFVSWGVLRKWKLQHNIKLVRAKKGRNIYHVSRSS